MDEKTNIILVPWDFTENCELALEHAVQLATVAHNEIMLMYMMPNFGIFNRLRSRLRPKDLSTLNRRLTEAAQKAQEQYGIKPQTLVLEGNSRKGLRNLIETAHVNLIVSYPVYKYKYSLIRMSRMLKSLVFKKMTLPFLLVSRKPQHTHYIEMAIPVFYDPKFKEAVQWIIRLAKYYHCNVNFIKPYLTDDYRKRQLASNMYFTKKMLDGVDIVYGIKTAKRSKIFEDEIFRFAENIEADLMLMVSDEYDKLIPKTREADLSVPVMCVNVRRRKYASFN